MSGQILSSLKVKMTMERILVARRCNFHKSFPIYTTLKMKFSIKDFFSKCDQIHSFLRIWSYLLKKSLMENFIFCVMLYSISAHDFMTLLTLLYCIFMNKIDVMCLSESLLDLFISADDIATFLGII